MNTKYKLSLVASALSMALVASSAHSVVLDKRTAAQKGVKTAVTKKPTVGRDVSNLYFVNLQDAPLAVYQGGTANLASTSAQSNKKNNKLNTKSSASMAYKSYLAKQQTSFIQKAKSVLGRKLTAEIQYSVVANAFTARLSEDEVALLESQPEVKFINKVEAKKLNTDSGPGFIKAPTAWDGTATGVSSMGEGMVVGVIDTGINPWSPSFADVGGDGYDHTNPLGEGNYLGDCLQYAKYCNDKLIGIVSFPEITSIDTPAGEDPIGVDYHSHGSHTASTTAGNIIKDKAILHNRAYMLSPCFTGDIC